MYSTSYGIDRELEDSNVTSNQEESFWDTFLPTTNECNYDDYDDGKHCDDESENEQFQDCERYETTVLSSLYIQ